MNIEITLTKEDLEFLRAGRQVVKDVRGTIVCLEYNPPIDCGWEEKFYRENKVIEQHFSKFPKE